MTGITKNVPVSQFITQLLGKLLFVLDHVLKNNIFTDITNTPLSTSENTLTSEKS